MRNVAKGRGWTINHAQVLGALAVMPDASFDAILTDVPYGFGNHQPTAEELLAYLGGAELDTGGDFMGHDWNVPSVHTWREFLRVLKPGGFLFSFAGPKTIDLIAIGIRAAGFEVRDTIASAWTFGTGFPKSQDASKAIDAMYLSRWLDERPLEKAWYVAASAWLSAKVKKGQPKPIDEHALAMQEAIERAAGTWREVVADDPQAAKRNKTTSKFESVYGAINDAPSCPITAAGTELAAIWDGQGTALKPSFEPIILARKPMPATLAENIEEHGVGALAIDAARIGVAKRVPGAVGDYPTRGFGNYKAQTGDESGHNPNIGRWPANLILAHLPGCVPVGTAKIKAAPAWNDNRPPSTFTGAKTSEVHHSDGDGTETVERWECVEGCAVAELDASAGALSSHGPASGPSRTSPNLAVAHGPRAGTAAPAPFYRDTGGASRFFYCAKASREERDRGCEHLPLRSAAEVTDSAEGAARLDSPRTGAGRTSGARNHHPCVKPVDLCRYLARLLLPPAGRPHGPRRILVPYAGSGSEMIGALLAGWDEVVGIERDADFVAILEARVAHAERNPRAFEPDAPTKTAPVDPRQVDLFGRVGT